MLLVHLVLSTVPETCLRIAEAQEENVAEHNHAGNTTKASTVDPHLAAALERNFVGNQSDVVEERHVPKVCLLRRLNGNSRWKPCIFSVIVRR
jgi:hypothetical protein